MQQKKAYITWIDGNNDMHIFANGDISLKGISYLPIRKLKKIARWCRKCNK